MRGSTTRPPGGRGRVARVGGAVALVAALVAAPAAHAQRIRFVPVATGFTRVTDLAHAGDDRLFVAEQAGVIRVVVSGQVLPTPFLDIRAKVGSGGGEQGLLGLVFHPGFAANRFFYVHYNDVNGDTVVARFRATFADPNVARPESERLILSEDQPFANHNGGDLAFGPRDGFLYVGLGDGGSGCDPGDRAQNRRSRLGKILRLDVDQGLPFTVPADNPFVGNAAFLPEIWSLGLRNPWRVAFDRAAPHDLFIADVGQSAWEEVSVQPGDSPGGENYGWDCFEGLHAGTCSTRAFCPPVGNVLPVHEYDHDAGCSITGGFVYRGTRFPGFFGEYFFADFCSRRLWSLAVDDGSFALTTYQDQVPGGPRSFGESPDGEIYVASSDAVYRLEDPAEPPPGAAACPAAPGVCDEPGQAVLVLGDALPAGPSSADRVVARLFDGTPTEPGAFGDPTADADLHLCVYAGTEPRLAFAATAAAGGTCAGVPCWSPLPSGGHGFADPTTAQDGLSRVVLRPAPAGSADARIVFRGVGTSLDLPPLPLAGGTTVSVRVRSSATDACWGVDFPPATVRRNDGQVFRAVRAPVEPGG